MFRQIDRRLSVREIAVLRIGFENCPRCYRAEIYASRPRGLWDRILLLASIQPVRCHDCMFRFYRPMFLSGEKPAPQKRAEVKKPSSNSSVQAGQERRSA
jgi:hypothetical protein